MDNAPIERKPQNWMRIAAAILIPLFTVWYIDRENRIHDLKEAIKRADKREVVLEQKVINAETETKHWIKEYINCERQKPPVLDTLTKYLRRKE